jgi:valyl-tRNA synthetase
MSDLEWVKSFIVAMRNIRGEMDIAPSKPLSILLRHVSLEGLIDKDAELARIQKARGKMSADVIDKEKANLVEFEVAKTKFEKQKAEIESL